MNANELRIGNYYEIFDHKFNPDFNGVRCFELEAASEMFKVFSDGSIFKISGIPLTEEWLLKFGFSKHDSGRFINFCREELIFSVTLNKETGKFNLVGEYTYDFPCNYVHQLQNLYFALTGEELTLRP